MPPPHAKSQDEAGCLLILLAVLWYAGFVSFNWGGDKDSAKRLTEVKAELAHAETQLNQISNVTEGMTRESDALQAQRTTLKRQVDELQQARDAIARNLETASNIIAPSKSGRWYAVGESLFTGVLGNLISAAILAAFAWWHGRRTGRAERVAEAD